VRLSNNEFAKAFLEHLCASADNIDYRIEAGEILRRSEDARIMPPIERPAAPVRVDTEAEAEERRIAFARKKAHVDRLTEEIAREFGLQPDGLSEKR
jgi:hypothetical protein